ncbi:pyrimidine-nucleoside phosphorylase [Heliobacterium chlorum]|uniref:Pyrimidine-nucleoside phosphorylase n=1 Tax=Heliobacterium chlorum TaxID=2698 RepID=A0ABR7T4C8_HELCL|nr:pyrimidine-nucleoside phosphorylase [Heliobacterium chlorum]MBC9784868.1 pyrimidine-nucleoside phosphorylase [Heliobacterium chlorum]
MRAYDIIAKKRDGQALTGEEIRTFIHGYARGDIPDYQAAAWSMAVYLKGMNVQETAALTEAMVTSGDQMNLSPIDGVKVDKHSTGGVGDTTTLILAPLLSAMAIPVAKMSGRGLGHTGGTLDKLESIPCMKVDLSTDEFIGQVQRIGIAVAGQTANLVPADKKLYALRDVTATVESIPLIASSVMSKKLASGADAILLDVKVGRAAFMKTKEEALKLAQAMVDIGSRLGRRTMALLTSMEQPLGNAVGNALEVAEAVAILANQSDCGFGPVSADLKKVTLELAARLAWMAGKASSVEEAMVLAEEKLSSGEALARFRLFVEAQGGDGRVVENPEEILPRSTYREPVRAKKAGIVTSLDGLIIGQAAAGLGAGRSKKEDAIDPAVGVVIHKRIGDPVEPGDVLAEIFANGRGRDEVRQLVYSAYTISEGSAQAPTLPLILGEVRPEQ